MRAVLKVPRHLYASLIVCVCVGGIGACSTAPVEETRAFASAVASVNSAGDLLLDGLAAAERRNHIAIAKASGRRWRVSDAPYYSTIGEPKDVEAFRNSLVVVKEYADLLVALAESDPEKARGQILAIASSLSKVAQAAQLAAVVQLAPALQLLTPIIDQAIAAHNFQELKRIALSGAPAVREIIEGLRRATPAMFAALFADARLTNASASARENQRVIVSNFVILLDRLDIALAELVDSFNRPSDPVTLSSLVRTATQLESDVVAARKALAAVRLAR